MNDRIVLYKSRKKAVMIIVAGLLLGMAGGWVLHATRDEAVGWMIVIFAVLTLVYGLGSFSDRKPYVILSERGITEMFTLREEIEWDAILHVDDFWFRGQNFVRLLLNRDYKPDRIRPTWFYRFDRLYARDGVKAVYIPVRNMEVNSQRLTRFIEKMVEADPSVRIAYLRRGINVQ